MAYRYNCTVDDCAWEHDGSRRTAAADADEVTAHQASHVDPQAPHDTPLPLTVVARTHYRWLWPLTIANGIALLLAVIAGFGGDGAAALGFFFPQFWGWRFPFGVALGVASILAILVSAFGTAAGGRDARDRRYRFLGGLTLSTSIMFAVMLIPGVLLLGALSGYRAP